MTKWCGTFVKYAYGEVDAETELEAEEKLANLQDHEMIPSMFYEDWVLETDSIHQIEE